MAQECAPGKGRAWVLRRGWARDRCVRNARFAVRPGDLKSAQEAYLPVCFLCVSQLETINLQESRPPSSLTYTKEPTDTLNFLPLVLFPTGTHKNLRSQAPPLPGI